MTDDDLRGADETQPMAPGEATNIHLPTELKMVHDVPPAQSVTRRAVQRRSQQRQRTFAVASMIFLIVGGWLLARFFVATMSSQSGGGEVNLILAIPALMVGYLLRISSRQR